MYTYSFILFILFIKGVNHCWQYDIVQSETWRRAYFDVGFSKNPHSMLCLKRCLRWLGWRFQRSQRTYNSKVYLLHRL